MKRNHQDIDQFFEQFRQLPEYYSLEKVQQLISKPDIGRTKSGNVNFNPLKFIIMTSAFTIGLLSLFFWFSPSVKNKAERYIRTMSNAVQVPKKIDKKNEEKADSGDGQKAISYVRKKAPSHITESTQLMRKNVIPLEIDPIRLSVNNSGSNNAKTYFDQVLKSMASQADQRSYKSSKANKPLEGLNFIELSDKELMALGFIIKGHEIRYTLESDDDIVDLVLYDEGQGVRIFEDSLVQGSVHKVVFLSNLHGKQNVMWKGPDDHKDKWEASYFQEQIQFLIPVVLRKSTYPDILYQDQIFWFEPTEEFFKALPESIGKQMEQEYSYLIAKNNSIKTKTNTSCTYFEACKSTLQLNGLKLYPNPARQFATIEFELSKDIAGSILLTDINGGILKTLIPKTAFHKGFVKYQLDLSGVPPGIYLVSIITNEGFKTRRLILSE